MTVGYRAVMAVVDPASIGIGERVMVVTGSGRQVAVGDVLAKGFSGINILIRSGNQVLSKTYESNLYSFIPVQADSEDDGLVDGVGVVEAEQVRPTMRRSEKPSRKDKATSIPGEEPDDSGEDGSQGVDDDEAGDARDDDVKSGEPVNQDSLPDKIKAHVGSPGTISNEKIDQVAGAVGEAALGALRRSGVEEVRIYSLVGMIVSAVSEVLSSVDGTKR